MFTKTIKLKVLADDRQIQRFRELTEAYRSACNSVSGYVFEHSFSLSSMALQKALYRTVREKFGLNSTMTCTVFRTVVARYKTVREQMKQKPYRYKDSDGKYKSIPRTLEWLEKPIEFRRPQADFVREDNYSFIEGGTRLSMTTMGKREKMGFCNKHFSEYFDGSWKFGTAKLVSLKGKWYLHIPVAKEIGRKFSKEKVSHVVGIDRGLRFLSVAYDGERTSFVDGKAISRKREKFAKIRSELQAKGTYSAKRTLRRLSERENRWMSDVNHRVSKTLVDSYGRGTLFVLEDLTGISFDEQNLRRGKGQKRELRSWSFYQLEQFLAYKAEEAGSSILKVSPRYTSQRCPKCGRIRKESRKHATHEYVCDACGYRSNDDRVGAMNIRELGKLWLAGNESPRFEK